jgi:Xaa-Pro aminopeptidase
VDLSPLRFSLTPHEVGIYRALGTDMGAVLGETAATFPRGESEFAVAGRLAAAMLEREITPVVLLVAGDERVEQYRHPLPTAATIDRLGMLVACGRRAGLIVSVTRLAHFGPLPAELRRRHEAVCRIDASFIAHTVPGSPVSAVFSAGVAAYAAEGFAEEWRLHHQGGPCGYLARDYKATFDTHQTVEAWQAFAWNPSITGTKSEDTMLATPEGPEILSGSPDWPLLPCAAAGRTLARAAILER